MSDCRLIQLVSFFYDFQKIMSTATFLCEKTQKSYRHVRVCCVQTVANVKVLPRFAGMCVQVVCTHGHEPIRLDEGLKEVVGHWTMLDKGGASMRG